MDENQGISTQGIKALHGGRRTGAGRKRLDFDARRFEARGINPLYAMEILARVADERKIWTRLLNSPDDNVVLRAMTFLMSMRDGKPSQQINVTSKNISISANDLATARDIARELSGMLAIPKLGTGEADIQRSEDGAKGEQKESIMVSGNQGAKIGE